MRYDPDHIARRLLQEAMKDATAAHYRRRALEFEAARHRPGIDWPGQATEDQLRTRWVALTEVAQACRARARVGVAEDVPELITTVFAEVA